MLLTLLYIRYFYNFTNIFTIRISVYFFNNINTHVHDKNSKCSEITTDKNISKHKITQWLLFTSFLYICQYYVIYTYDFNRATKQILTSF